MLVMVWRLFHSMSEAMSQVPPLLFDPLPVTTLEVLLNWMGRVMLKDPEFCERISVAELLTAILPVPTVPIVSGREPPAFSLSEPSLTLMSPLPLTLTAPKVSWPVPDLLRCAFRVSEPWVPLPATSLMAIPRSAAWVPA